jgi:hypothetical protein
LLVTFSEFAALKGCAKGTVTAATKNRIAAAVVEKDGKRWLDRDLALELWRKNTKSTHNAKVSVPDDVELELPASPRELRKAIDALPDDAIPELNESRARREHYQAELAKLQVAQQRKELVPAEEVKKQAFQIGRSVREALSNLADRLSHQLAGETDPTVIHQLLSDEHRDALLALVEADR